MRASIRTLLLTAAFSFGIAAPVAAPAFAQDHARHGTPASAGHASHATGGHADAPNAVAEADQETERHGEAEEHGPPKAINWFDFGNKEQPPYGAMLINFALLIGIYVYYGKKPVADALKARRATVAKEIEEAQKIRAEAEARAVKYQEKLASLETELKETRAALVEAGKSERDRIVREAKEKAERMERDATFLVEQELKQMRAELTREVVEQAVLAAEEILAKRVTPADQDRLAEEYLNQLVARRPSYGPSSGGGLSGPPSGRSGLTGSAGPESRRSGQGGVAS